MTDNADWLVTEVTAEDAKPNEQRGGEVMPKGNYDVTIFEAKHERPGWAGPNGIYNLHLRVFGEKYENRRLFVNLPIDSSQGGFFMTKDFMEAIGKPVVEGANHWPLPETLAGMQLSVYVAHQGYDASTKKSVNDSKNHLAAFNAIKQLVEGGNTETVPHPKKAGETVPRYQIQERVAGINKPGTASGSTGSMPAPAGGGVTAPAAPKNPVWD